MGPWAPALALLGVAVFISYLLPAIFRLVTRIIRGVLFGVVALVALTVAGNETTVKLLSDAASSVVSAVNGIVAVVSNFF